MLSTNVFPPTDQALLNRAKHRDAEALARLCDAYWYPVYSYLRRKGASPEDAKDLTQDLFARLIVCERFAQTDFGAKRFRAWLRLNAKNRFLNARARRDGNHRVRQHRISFDTGAAEARLNREAMHLATPEQLFDRCWARTVAARAFAQFKTRTSRPEDVALTLELCAELSGQLEHAEARSDDGPQSCSARQTRCRRRKRLLDEYRRCVRREVRLTVQHPSEVDDELRVLSDLLP